MTEKKRKLNLAQLVNYEVKVPGEIDPTWADWHGELTISVEMTKGGISVSTISGVFDQAGLHSLLRRLYSFGLPLISVICVGFKEADD